MALAWFGCDLKEPGKASNMTIKYTERTKCGDEEEDTTKLTDSDILFHLTPTGVQLPKEVQEAVRRAPELQRVFEDVLRPLAAEMDRLRKQVGQCELRIQQLMTQTGTGPVSKQGAGELDKPVNGCPAHGVDLQELHSAQAGLQRQLEEGRKATTALEGALAAAQEAHKATEDDVRRLGEEVHTLIAADMALGDPIGRTFNTQDWANMHAETRRELEETRNKVDELMAAFMRKGETGRHGVLKPSTFSL